jgi:hypothetical protein
VFFSEVDPVRVEKTRQKSNAPFQFSRNGKGSSRAIQSRNSAWHNRGLEMFSSTTTAKQPLAYCAPCSERTPHRYERLGVNGRLTSRAICLVCNNDSRGDAPRQSATDSSP